MRIIGGNHSGFRFEPPKNIPARPTTDVAKEGLFNILYNTFDFSALSILDLFGGTGSISYEFASRGCPDITLVELDKRSLTFIEQTTERLQLPIQIVKADVFKFIAHCTEQYDLIFAGPPYPLPNLHTLPDLVFSYDLLKPESWFILEHNPNHNFDKHPHFIQKRNYGTTIFSIFESPKQAE
jgi:16S rRNA (guanine966-N2)-methyltransferase